MLDLKVPAFGVCLGLQGIVEYFGGELAVLDYPMHGKVRPCFFRSSKEEGWRERETETT